MPSPGHLLFLPCMFCALFFPLTRAEACENGVHNTIALLDLSGGADPIVFSDVKLATFDAEFRPHCVADKGALSLPGFVQFISGTIDVRRPIKNSLDQKVMLELSAQQNSYFVGEVCRLGKSQNMFVPDDYCSWDVCAALGWDSCEFLEHKGRAQIAELYPKPIPLEPAQVDQIEGEWTLSATLRTRRGQTLARVALPRGWHTVRIDTDANEAAFRRRASDVHTKEEL